MSGRSRLCCNVMAQQKSPATGSVLGPVLAVGNPRNVLSSIIGAGEMGAPGCRQSLALQLFHGPTREGWRRCDVERRGTHSLVEERTMYRSDFEL